MKDESQVENLHNNAYSHNNTYLFTGYSLIMRIRSLEQHGFTQQKAYCSLLILIMHINEYALLIHITNNRQ